MITVKVNEVAHQVASNTSLEHILQQLNIDVSGIAVAINQNIITRQEWQNTSLKTNDDILIIKATQGG